MKNEDYLDKLHSDILLIMDEIDRVCSENGLKYYLAGGTCIGALRHQGFIPWDDDMDIIMPYDDFKVFVSIAPTALKSSFFLRWHNTEDRYHQDFAKVCLRNTLFLDSLEMSPERSGIFVDIFPVFPTRAYGMGIQIKSRVVHFLKAAIWLRASNRKVRAHQFFKFILSRVFSSKTLFKLIVWVIHPVSQSRATHYTCYASTYPIERQVIPIDWYGDGVRLPFEGRLYMCASKSDEKMRFEYGNYMQIPPPEKRKTHCPLKVVFSDGTSLCFEQLESKVSYADLID